MNKKTVVISRNDANANSEICFLDVCINGENPGQTRSDVSYKDLSTEEKKKFDDCVEMLESKTV